MFVLLRSQLIAGTATVLGASLIAITPAEAGRQLPALPLTSWNQIALASYNSPISELFSTIGVANQFVFNTSDSDADYLAFAGLDAASAAIAKTVYGFSSIGLVPQLINDHFPIVSQLVLNWSAYGLNTINTLTSIGFTLSEGAWNFPQAAAAAVQQAIAGNIPGAVATLVQAVVDPLQAAGATAVAAMTYHLGNMLAKASAVLSAIPTIVQVNGVQNTIAQTQVLVSTVAGVRANIAAGIKARDPEATWNAVVDGLFGPTGIPGTLINLTIGAGVQTGPGTIVPSMRGDIQAALNILATALTTTVPAPPVPPPPTAADPTSPPTVPVPEQARRSTAPKPPSIRSSAKGSSSLTAHRDSGPAVLASDGSPKVRSTVGRPRVRTAHPGATP
jgi:hypothetical protein